MRPRRVAAATSLSLDGLHQLEPPVRVDAVCNVFRDKSLWADSTGEDRLFVAMQFVTYYVTNVRWRIPPARARWMAAAPCRAVGALVNHPGTTERAPPGFAAIRVNWRIPLVDAVQS